MQLTQGHIDVAYRSLERSLQGTDWSSAQRKGLYLAHLVRVAAAVGDSHRVHETLVMLEAAPELWPASALSVTLARARGELALF
ncbi:hypothetical protein [Sedimenticola sp.]|uniref:hypothetical protein n=1 Tax=Sedimenticola sp. TaxID=1940285 RepID=UPI003D138519